jgi:hypothetical protein
VLPQKLMATGAFRETYETVGRRGDAFSAQKLAFPNFFQSFSKLLLGFFPRRFKDINDLYVQKSASPPIFLWARINGYQGVKKASSVALFFKTILPQERDRGGRSRREALDPQCTFFCRQGFRRSSHQPAPDASTPAAGKPNTGIACNGNSEMSRNYFSKIESVSLL